jgi:hypothetical protein
MLTVTAQYIGQAAYISRIPSAYANPFYLTVPPGMLYPSLVVAVLACIVASQAVITGSFQVCLLRLLSPINPNNAVAFVANHEAFLLPPSQNLSRLKDIPWPGLHPHRQLAHDDWHSRRDCCI